MDLFILNAIFGTMVALYMVGDFIVARQKKPSSPPVAGKKQNLIIKMKGEKRMSKWKKIIFSVLFTALIITDGAQLFNTSVSTDSQYVQAGLLPKFKLMKKHYDGNGNFIGCWGSGADCIVIPLLNGEVNISLEGIHMQ